MQSLTFLIKNKQKTVIQQVNEQPPLFKAV